MPHGASGRAVYEGFMSEEPSSCGPDTLCDLKQVRVSAFQHQASLDMVVRTAYLRWVRVLVSRQDLGSLSKPQNTVGMINE